MKLNPDCIRDVLLTVEKHATFIQQVDTQEFIDDGLFDKYGEDTLLYHVREVSDAGLVLELQFFMSGEFIIKDLSPEGHDFLANIRSDNNWEKTKSVASKAGSFSLEILKSAANGVAIALLNKALGQ